jgi:uncharacterized protein
MYSMVALTAGLALMVPYADAVAQSRADQVSAESIMRKNSGVSKVNDSISAATFTLISKDGSERVRKVAGFTRLAANGTDNMRLVRFVSPADIKGTATLLVERSDSEDDIWVYLPALNKVRRLSAANKKSAYVGTDFSFGDIVGYRISDWKHKLLREELQGGVLCYVVESLPADEAVQESSGYGKRLSWIDKQSHVAVRVDMWDTAMQPLKTIVSSDIQPTGQPGKSQPMVSEATNLQTGHKTVLKFDEYKANQSVSASLFTAKELER